MCREQKQEEYADYYTASQGSNSKAVKRLWDSWFDLELSLVRLLSLALDYVESPDSYWDTKSHWNTDFICSFSLHNSFSCFSARTSESLSLCLCCFLFLLDGVHSGDLLWGGAFSAFRGVSFLRSALLKGGTSQYSDIWYLERDLTAHVLYREILIALRWTK